MGFQLEIPPVPTLGDHRSLVNYLTLQRELLIRLVKHMNDGGGRLDHGGLGGLADDDHTQYTRKDILTTTGDIYYASAASTPARLGIGANKTTLRSTGSAPFWDDTAIPSNAVSESDQAPQTGNALRYDGTGWQFVGESDVGGFAKALMLGGM